MITKINDVEFTAVETSPYIQDLDLSITIRVIANSIYEVATAAGELADIEIENLFIGKGYALMFVHVIEINLTKVIEAKFVPSSVLEKIGINTDDIETLSGAVIELAEIIGGDE